MKEQNKQVDNLLRDLQERAKELNCLYKVEELLGNTGATLEELFKGIIEILPPGWQFPEICQAVITYDDKTYRSPNFKETPWKQSADIMIQGKIVGKISVSYSKKPPHTESGYFLKEETKLINTIADRMGHTILHKRLRSISGEWKKIKEELSKEKGNQWRGIIDVLLKSDRNLFIYISQKLLRYLCWNGIQDANSLLEKFGSNNQGMFNDSNRPHRKETIDNLLSLGNEIFRIASENFSSNQILPYIQKWVREDKLRFLVKAIDDPISSLREVVDAITRYHYYNETEEFDFSPYLKKGLRVSLIHRFFSDQLEFVNVAKNYIHVSDYYDFVKRIISPAKSLGRLGGKSAGLFLATQILNKTNEYTELFANIKVPKTWYITSDGLIDFLYYNNLEEVIEQKYKEIDEIHFEYQNIVQMFKNSHFSPEVVKGLSTAIDDFGNHPIIVRSSSLLEDSFGASFSGKYKSLFLANQGSKQERLDALMDAIAEIYASTFAPDPIEYRRERGLLDFFEEMGIMIQEVVGTRVGNYFFPSFAGVAFSNNEFRWSSRIDREDGLVRMVPGLGTRAVDRLSDDYPILIAPGKPELRVNTAPDEVLRYSPEKIDVINLDNNIFETIEISELLKKYGDKIPGIRHIVSVYENDYIHKPGSLLNVNFDKNNLVVTFEGLVSRTPFLKQIRVLLSVFQEKIGTPIDIEFAHDGKNLYLLQCRSQSYSKDILPSSIPKDIPRDQIVFSANRYVSNGFVPDISHIVYVDPKMYNRLSDLSVLQNVGRVVGKLNKILPKRRFILMGPGRWGSRGDIKLGVNVTYSDINNTALLVEIAQKIGNYTPDLSFGTHFFQDLVESSIRYLPLYPDDENVVFNESFFLRAKNVLSELLPEFSNLSNVVRVIDVPQNTGGLVLHILMNSDLEKAVGLLTNPETKTYHPKERKEYVEDRTEDFWLWRLHMVEQIASQLDAERFGVKGFYVFGSVKNATAGPASDIDILVHFNGSEEQKKNLLLWLEGWSLSLAEMNYLKTGYKSDGLLDVHVVTDRDIAKKTSFAVKIGAVSDAARPLSLGRKT